MYFVKSKRFFSYRQAYSYCRQEGLDPAYEIRIEGEGCCKLCWPVETADWKYKPGSSSLLEYHGQRKIGQIAEELRAYLKIRGVRIDEFFRVLSFKENQPWPRGRIHCYTITGTEGHYTFVGVRDLMGHYDDILMIKTYLGMEHALRIAGICTVALGA